MSHSGEFTWKRIAEEAEESARKFAWISIALFLISVVFAYTSLSNHLRHSSACEYIGQNAPVFASQRTEQGAFASALLKHCR